MKNCSDCGVEPGELHKQGCNRPRCTICGKLLFTCNHNPVGNSVYTGVEYQEVKILAEALYLYHRYDPAIGWVSCSEQADGASYDINKASSIYQDTFEKVKLKERD